MSELSLSSEQLPHINPVTEKQRLRREHLNRIGDLAVRDFNPCEEALVERTRELAIMKEIREFGQTAIPTGPIQVAEVESVQIQIEQLRLVKERLLDFINHGIALSDHFIEVVHVEAEIDRQVLDIVIGQLRQEGIIIHTAIGYVKAPTGEDHKVWLDATITAPTYVIRSNN